MWACHAEADTFHQSLARLIRDDRILAGERALRSDSRKAGFSPFYSRVIPSPSVKDRAWTNTIGRIPPSAGDAAGPGTTSTFGPRQAGRVCQRFQPYNVTSIRLLTIPSTTLTDTTWVSVASGFGLNTSIVTLPSPSVVKPPVA